MGEVVKLSEREEPVEGAEATAKIVQFLREHADMLESGELRPVHKAVLTVYESIGDQFRIQSAFCNATTLERVGIVTMALQDIMDAD